MTALTAKQIHILTELAAGRLLKDIAAGMGISYSTAKNYSRIARDKLAACSMTEAVYLFAKERHDNHKISLG
jgi:DNA-binding NarL/FixJ family response regulator